MFLADSNIVIYGTDPRFPSVRDFIIAHAPAVSSVSMVEVLGYHSLTTDKRDEFEAFFAEAMVLPVSAAVIDRAVALRQTKKMALGDALIAATALTTGRTLVTRNIRDFAWIVGLTLLDPLAGPPLNGTPSPP